MFVKYLKLTIFLLAIAVIYNMFLVPTHLVTGGSGGLGIILNKTHGLEPYAVIFFVSALMFLLSCMFLKAKQIFSTLYITIMYPFFVKLVSFYNFEGFFAGENILTLVLISAIITGFFQGAIFKMGFNIGGFSVLAVVINKYFKTSVTMINTIINAIIVLIGAGIFGIENILYAIVFLILSRFISERVLLGTSRNKTFKIISSEYLKIEKFINKELLHDATIYDTYGGYKDKKRKLIMTMIPNSDFVVLKEYVKSVDKKAFIFVSDTYEVGGQDNLVKESVK